MNSKAPKQGASETERKKTKLKLNKETLKDLSAGDKDVKGGLAGHPSQNDTECGSCNNNCS